MEWEEINIKEIMNALREFEKESIMINGEYAIIYSDGNEELKISYKKLNKTQNEENENTR